MFVFLYLVSFFILVYFLNWPNIMFYKALEGSLYIHPYVCIPVCLQLSGAAEHIGTDSQRALEERLGSNVSGALMSYLPATVWSLIGAPIILM